MKKIKLSNALAMLCNIRDKHTIKYRKASADQLGKSGYKEGVTVYTTKSDNAMSASKKFGANGLIKLWEPRTGHTFDVIIDLLTHIDGMVIEHPYN